MIVMVTDTCWGCEKKFQRKKDEFYCETCQKEGRNSPIRGPVVTFKGKGFYTTDKENN